MNTKQRDRRRRKPDRKALGEIIKRVVEVAQPDKIILFGLGRAR